MKQTAVEWLESEFQEMCKDFGGLHTDFIERFKQAKAMQKEQSEFICVNVIEMILDKLEQGKEINSKEIFEDVYKQIFKSESFCNCPKGKGIDFDENQKAYCIDCGKNINL